MNSAGTMRIAVATAVIVLPLFAPQPLVGAISTSLHFPYWAVNTSATVTLLGYATGHFLLTPLIDLFKLRRLVVTTVVADAVALTVAAVAPSAAIFLCSAFLVGVMTSSIQMLVPMAAMLAPEARRGRVIGNDLVWFATSTRMAKRSVMNSVKLTCSNIAASGCRFEASSLADPHPSKDRLSGAASCATLL